MKRTIKIETPEVRTTEVYDGRLFGVWVTRIKEVISSTEITDYDEPLEGAKEDFIFLEHSASIREYNNYIGAKFYYSNIMKGDEIIRRLTDYKNGRDVCLKEDLWAAIVKRDNSVELKPATVNINGENVMTQIRADREYRITCVYNKREDLCYLNINKTNYKYLKKKFRLY